MKVHDLIDKLECFDPESELLVSIYISSEDGVLLEEALSDRQYETSYLLSGFYPYATSEKKLSLTLERDAEALTLACENAWLHWSGQDVTLPERDAVERWYSYTAYDAWLNGEPEAFGMRLEQTSRVMICPNRYDEGRHITIRQDVTYTSEAVWEESTKETIDAWGEAIHGFSPDCLIRFENAYFNAGTSQASMLRYYEDLLSMCDRCGFDWYSNDFHYLFYNDYAGFVMERDGDFFGNAELLHLLQRHQ